MLSFILLVVVPMTLNAKDKTIIGEEVEIGGFAGPVLKVIFIEDKISLMLGIRGAFILNNTFTFGGSYFALHEGINKNVDGTIRRLQIGYGGLEPGLILFSRRIIHLSGHVLIGAGKASYEFDNINIDNFFILEPTAYFELNVLKNFRVSAGAGYRFVFDVDQIEGLSNEDLSGLSAEILFKIGVF